MGPSMGLVSSWLPSMWIPLIMALTVKAVKIFFYWLFN